MVIDDAEQYFLNFEHDTPNEAGGTHIGLFLGWAMIRGLASEEMATRLPALLAREVTGRDLLFQHCDGKLMASDLGERGGAFAESYAFGLRWCTGHRAAGLHWVRHGGGLPPTPAAG